MFNLFRPYGIFLIVPGISLYFSVLLKLAAGPYWLATNFDPSYLYLINGAYLVKGFSLNDTTHPGTPLQILCCAVYWSFNLGRSAEDVIIRVLMRPEFYLHTIFVVLTAFSFFSTFGLAVYVFRKTNDTLAALLSQLPVLCFLTMKSWETTQAVLPVVANISPEAMLIGILNLFNIALFMNYFAQTNKEKCLAAIIWGIVCGLGAAVKITVVPLLAVPLVLLTWKNRFIFICVFALSFVVWTLPLLSKFPMVGWLITIEKMGPFKPGGHNTSEIFDYMMIWKNILVQQGVFVCFLVASVSLVVWKLTVKKWDRGTTYLLATILGAALQFSSVPQHPGAHYLLPGLGLFSSMVVLFYFQCHARQELRRRTAMALILFFAFWGTLQALTYRTQVQNLTDGIISFHNDVLEKYQNCTFVDHYRSSDVKAALYFGDVWNGSPHLTAELLHLYSNEYYFQLWGKNIKSFNGRVLADDLLDQNPCVLFRGDGRFNFDRGPYQLQLLEKGPFENIQMLKGSTEKQAIILFTKAMQYSKEGDLLKARQYALEAKALHFQPEQVVDALIRNSGGI